MKTGNDRQNSLTEQLFRKLPPSLVQFLKCNLLSFLITVLISYLLNSRFVFRQQEEGRQPWYKALAKVYASYALTELVLMGILLFVQERLLGIPHYIATFLNLCITVPLNFLLNKFWAYRKKP